VQEGKRRKGVVWRRAIATFAFSAPVSLFCPNICEKTQQKRIISEKQLHDKLSVGFKSAYDV
jgi:hypothetical protein